MARKIYLLPKRKSTVPLLEFGKESWRNTELITRHFILPFQVVTDLVQGEFMQLGSKETENERFAHYLTKTYRKTASLIANSAKAVSVPKPFCALSTRLSKESKVVRVTYRNFSFTRIRTLGFQSTNVSHLPREYRVFTFFVRTTVRDSTLSNVRCLEV